jgi:hypothetical protein
MKLVVVLAEVSLAKRLLMRDELENLVRNAAIELQLTVAETGSPYTQLTDVSALVDAMVRRAARDGVSILERTEEHALERQLLVNETPESLEGYTAKINPALIEFQDKHCKLSLKDVGNWDETRLDLRALARQTHGFLGPRHVGSRVGASFESQPGTVVVGFAGSEGMVPLLITKGVYGLAPRQAHARAQLAGDGCNVFLGQTATGSIDNALKTPSCGCSSARASSAPA